MPKEIILDKKTFEALAIDTRVDILKSLKKRNKTASELSKELKLAVSTVSEHLDKMKKANLIKRKEDHRKWVYYQLTEKGKSIVSPTDKTSVFIMALSISLLMIVLGFYWLSSMGAGTGSMRFGGTNATPGGGGAESDFFGYGFGDQPDWAGKAAVNIFDTYEEEYGINIQALTALPVGPTRGEEAPETQTNAGILNNPNEGEAVRLVGQFVYSNITQCMPIAPFNYVYHFVDDTGAIHYDPMSNGEDIIEVGDQEVEILATVKTYNGQYCEYDTTNITETYLEINAVQALS